MLANLGPLFCLWVEVVVALKTMLATVSYTDFLTVTYPKTLHHLALVDTELLSVLDGELADSESPAVETGTKGNCALVWVHLDVTEGLVEISGNDDVDRLDSS